MEYAWIVAKQTFTMFLYMMIGYALRKTGKIDEKGSKGLGTLMLWVVIPLLIIKNFMTDNSPEQIMGFLLSFLVGAAALGISMAISALVFRKKPVEIFGTSFSNAAFMGMPLVEAVLGANAVFFTIGVVALLNVLQATYGVAIMTAGERKTKVRDILLNPVLLSMVVGLVIFFTGVGKYFPAPFVTVITGAAALNAPVAMILLGTYLALTPLKELFTFKRGYFVSLIRLIAIPAVTVLFLWVIPCSREIKLTIFLMMAAPVGSNVAMYAQLNGSDYSKACQLVSLSTLLSMITLPLMTILAGMIL